MILFSQFKKTLIAFPTVLVFQSLILISEKQPDLLVSERLVSLVLGSITYPDAKFFVFALENLVYIFLFEMLFGHYIYNELKYSSTYVFSRITSTKRWFLNKSMELAMYAMVYILFYLGSMLFLSIYSTGNVPDAATWVLFVQLFLKFSAICFIGTLLINVLSFYIGSMVSFLAVYAVQVFEVFLIMNVMAFPVIREHPEIIKWLPMSSLVISKVNYATLYILDLLYIFTLVAVCILFSQTLVKKTDLSLVKYH